MSTTTFTPPATVNGINGRSKSTTIKLADQLNGAATSSHLGTNGLSDEFGFSGKVRADVRNMAHAASQASEGAQLHAVDLVRGVTQKAVETSAATVGYGVGIAKAFGSFYVNAAAAVIGYSAASAAHIARVGVDTTANVTGYGVNKAEETILSGYHKAHHFAGYAVGSSYALAQETAQVAHATAKKVLPASVVSRAETVAGVAQVLIENPVDTAKEILPAPIFNTVQWSIGTAFDAKNKTYTAAATTRALVHNTAHAFVDTARSKLQATEDFAYNKAVESYENAKTAVGFGSPVATTA